MAKEPWLIEKGKALQLTGDTDVRGRRDLPGGAWSNDSGAAAELSDGTILLLYATIYKTAETTWPEKRLQLLILPPGALAK